MAVNRSLLRGLLVGLCALSGLAHADIHRSHAMAMHGTPNIRQIFSTWIM
jgi:microcin C transport system substrate-binding protein